MNRIVDRGVIIALFTAFLFALSIANYHGYLDAIGVERGFIIKSSHQILYNAIFVILLPALKILLLGFLGFFLLSGLVGIYTQVSRGSYHVRKGLVTLRKNFAINILKVNLKK